MGVLMDATRRIAEKEAEAIEACVRSVVERAVSIDDVTIEVDLPAHKTFICERGERVLSVHVDLTGPKPAVVTSTVPRTRST